MILQAIFGMTAMWLLYAGFVRAPSRLGVGAWPMYSQGTGSVAELLTSDGARVSPFAVRDAGEFWLNPHEVDDIRRHLAELGVETRICGRAYGYFGFGVIVEDDTGVAVQVDS